MKSNFFLVEINTQRQQFKSCLLCFKDFSVMTKEHQCKRCKRAVCDKCAQNKMIILGYSKSKDPHRVCNVCKAESDMLKQFVRTNQIQFNRDSIGIEWLQNMSVDLRSLKDIYRVREQRDQMEYNQFINQVDSIYDEIEKKMNYSIREFFSLINLEKKVALISLKNLLGTFLKNNPEVGFHPSLIFLALILLSISSEPTAYYLIEQLYTKTIPKQVHFRNLRLGYEFKSELTLILNSFHNLKIPSEPIKPFLQDIAPYIVSLTVNAFEIQSTLFILSQLFQEDGYHEFVKVLACALSTHQFKDGQQHKVFLMWNVKEQNFQKYYYDMKKLRCNSSSTIRSVSLSDQQQQQEAEFKLQIDQLKKENTQLNQEQTIDRMKIVQQKINIDKYNEQIIDLEDEIKNFKQKYAKIEQENQNLLEQNQNLKLQLMKQGNDSSSITQSTKSDTTNLENELLKCKQEIEVLKLQNTNPNQMTQLVKIKNEQIAKLSQEKAELERRIEDLEEPKISKRTSSVAQINSVIKDLEDGKNLLEKKNQEILQLKKQLSDLQQQNQKNQSMTSSQQLLEQNNPRKIDNIEDTYNKDLQLLIQDIDPAKKAAARNLKQLINKLQEEIIYYKTQAELKKEQVEPFRQKSESLQKQLDFLVEQNKELQIEIEHKQDLIQELEKKKMKASIEPRPQVVDDRKVLNENKSSCAANSDCIIF